MLAIIIVCFIGLQYYRLAEEFHKEKWGFAILGVLSYYGGIYLLGFIIAVTMDILSSGFIDAVYKVLFNIYEMSFTVYMFPLGALTSYLLYRWLERKWEKETPDNEIDITQND